ncbi:ABC transporter ATP-binding protein [Clostridium cochlearium]|uniref:ABC transporter ATP-binding protein n=1 Tax=Clostridium cochlearium TaxID=1494 RepID=A0A7Y4DEZ7_CLOCO|nr:ABC transporter ATP-binding protein [Clostridium cochlearium]NOH17281.1 ABC transporter ATP-binding protein [Clostridium cochlearium]
MAEKLRKLPLSYFSKNNLSDLTNIVMGDCTTKEHAFSYAIPQFYGAICSTIIINLLIIDWRMGITV